MAFCRKLGKICGVLIDFDLAIYPEDAAIPFIKTTSLPAPEAEADTVSTAGSQVSESEPDTDGDGILNQNGKTRSGTPSFMAIEALDFTASSYKHHLCHDLESILYASVWHGLGYRNNAGVFPKPDTGDDDEITPPDYLLVWREGSWLDVIIEKGVFLSNPEQITNKICHSRLRLICLSLAQEFRVRQKFTPQLSDRACWERRVSLLEQGLDPQVNLDSGESVLHYGRVFYPTFARVLHQEAVECTMDCCINALGLTMNIPS